MKYAIAIAGLFIALAGSVFAATDTEVKQAIIRESIAGYSGSCPCPYNTDRAGHSCGRRSAYSRPGGASPVCYDSDVTAAMVQDYRASHSGNRHSKYAPVRRITG